MAKTQEMLYIGKTTGEHKQNSIIKVKMVEVKDDSGKVVDHTLPPSLVGRVREAGIADKGGDDSKKELAEAKKTIAELEAKLAELEKANAEPAPKK